MSSSGAIFMRQVPRKRPSFARSGGCCWRVSSRRSPAGFSLAEASCAEIDAITDTCRRIMAGRLGDRIAVRGSTPQRAGSSFRHDQRYARPNRYADGEPAPGLDRHCTRFAHTARASALSAGARPDGGEEHGRLRQDHRCGASRTLTSCSPCSPRCCASRSSRRALAAWEFEEVAAWPAAGARGRSLQTGDGRWRPVFRRVVVAMRPRTRRSAIADTARRESSADNAIHHTPAGTRIALAAAMDGARPMLVVGDEGPGNISRRPREGIPPLLPLRAKPHDAGSGLGLALVSAIADLHDAEISLHDNRPGLRVVVRFPAAA